MKKFNVEIMGMDMETTEWSNVWENDWCEEPFEAGNEYDAIKLAIDYFVEHSDNCVISISNDESVIVEYYEPLDENNDLFIINSVKYIFRAKEITE